MSEQTTKNKQGSSSAPPVKKTEPKDLKNEELAASTEEVKDKIDALIEDKGMDDLLDEIDNVLEENCEEFVKNYVQRGGQ